jgi:hypothetical protein
MQAVFANTVTVDRLHIALIKRVFEKGNDEEKQLTLDLKRKTKLKRGYRKR